MRAFSAFAIRARRILDDAGFPDIRIIASGGLDEYSIENLVRRNAPIDGFGVGTRAITSADAPYADFVYKLVEYEGEPKMKLSEGKASLPMRKQVYRQFAADGAMRADLIAPADGEPPSDEWTPLLETVIDNGEKSAPSPGLDAIRAFHADRMSRLPSGLRGARPAGAYSVEVAEELASAGR